MIITIIIIKKNSQKIAHGYNYFVLALLTLLYLSLLLKLESGKNYNNEAPNFQ